MTMNKRGQGVKPFASQSATLVADVVITYKPLGFLG